MILWRLSEIVRKRAGGDFLNLVLIKKKLFKRAAVIGWTPHRLLAGVRISADRWARIYASSTAANKALVSVRRPERDAYISRLTAVSQPTMGICLSHHQDSVAQCIFIVGSRHEQKLKCMVGTKIPLPCWHSYQKECLRYQAINPTLPKLLKAWEDRLHEAKGVSVSTTGHEC